MISNKQQEANQANAQKSTGPRTEEGKQRSKLNAMRHGLTAQVTVMPEEEREAFDVFSNPLIDSFQPETPMETQLAVTIATWQWRINRAAAIEEGIYSRGFFTGAAEELKLDHPQVHNSFSNAQVFCQEQLTFNRLSLYTGRLMSQSDQAIKQLNQLQATRKTKADKSMNDATMIQRYLEYKGLPFNPAEHGFVFSAAKIRPETDRKILNERVASHLTPAPMTRKSAA